MKNNIKYLVLSGGGVKLYSQLGVLKQLIENETLNLDNITHFYGTSAGCMVCVPLAMGLDIDTISNYFLKRPWDKLFKVDIFNIVFAFSNCALVNKDLIYKAYEPLFKAANIDMNIDLETLYEITKKELHIYSTNITDGVAEDISYLTHPKWKLVDAIHASFCIPILFEPLIKDDKCYIDGGVFSNFPINYLNDIDKDMICGICFNLNVKNSDKKDIKFDNMIEYLQYVFINGFKNLVKDKSKDKFNIDEYKYVYNLDIDRGVNITSIISIWSDKEKRYELYQRGIDYIKEIII
tara:strand:+ start:2189 stop:3070 length:882 start_codon:yes stop_codon:yes gene_type:complete